MRYLLDTEVLVDALLNPPCARLETWLERHASSGLGICVLTVLELQTGLARFAGGADHNVLMDWIGDVEARFENAVLAFDEAAAQCGARLQTRGETCGLPVSLAQAMLAGVAEANGLILVARRTPHLALWGGPMVDPWS